MKCPNCKTDMEMGKLSLHGTRWSPEKSFSPDSAIMNVMMGKGNNIAAYKCPSCGKVELTINPK